MKTIEQIKKNDKFLCGMEFDELKTSLYVLKTDTVYLQYYLFFKNKLIFEGKDYRPSPLHDKDSIESLVYLLGFLTVQEWDTDSEYFKDYGPLQWEWSKSPENEYLKGLVSDFDMREYDFYYNAFEIFKNAYIS
jgi:hypothetical protein